MSDSIYPTVQLGADPEIGAAVIIGLPCKAAGGQATTIGDRAVVRSHTVIYAGNTIGNRFSTGHGVMVRELNQIGDNVSIGSHSVVEHHVTLKDNVRIHTSAFVPEFSVIEEGAWIGPHAVRTNAVYPLCRDAKSTLRGPVVKRGAKLGANVTILPGVVVGEGALIGAGSVVTKNVPDYAVVAGNPARVINDVRELPQYEIT